VFQVVTQIQEMTLTFIPKLALVVVLFLLLGSWMMAVVVSFARQVIGLAGGLGGV
jgi:flagellar biosynthetic protein FliQ